MSNGTGHHCDFDVPNLDCFSDDPDDLNAVAEVLETLGRYARAKAQAMQSRLDGNILNALVTETVCERIYNRLPAWAKW